MRRKTDNRLIFLTFAFLLSFIFAAAYDVFGQQTTRLTRRCAGATPVVAQSVIDLEKDGDINLQPCNGRTIQVNGSTVTFGSPITGLSGSSRTNFFPYFNGETTLAKSPFGWNGTLYTWNNTALNSEFTQEFTPSTAAGRWRVGDFTTTPTNYLDLNQSTNIFEARATTTNLRATTTTILTPTQTLATFTDSNILIGISNANVKSVVGSLTLGDTEGAANNTLLTIDDDNTRIRGAASSDVSFSTISGTSGIEMGGLTTIGDIFNNGNRTKLEINDGTTTFAFKNVTATGIFDLDEVLNYQLYRTITAAATTGNQTINKPAGTVNFAAGATTLTVTNSTVSATSIIFCTIQNQDTTATSCFVTKGAGSFQVRLNAAATAETSVGFLVTN